MKILLSLLLASALWAGLPFRCTGCERDDDGKIKRSRKAVNAFKKRNPAPSECKKLGCVVDHIVPLACAVTPEEHKALDVPANMQWQTKTAGKAKDRWEKDLCERDSIKRGEIARARGQRLPFIAWPQVTVTRSASDSSPDLLFGGGVFVRSAQ
jgi:hypothetical protein